MITGFGLLITRGDINTLFSLIWLNDEITNFYVNLPMQRGSLNNYPKVYAVNSFFYLKLLLTGHVGNERWTAKFDLFDSELVSVTVHLGNHWWVSVMDLRWKKILYFDSMTSRNQLCLLSLKDLMQKHLNKKKILVVFSSWQLENGQNVPKVKKMEVTVEYLHVWLPSVYVHREDSTSARMVCNTSEKKFLMK